MSPIPEASPRSEKAMSTTDQVTAMCQQMSLELAFLTNSTANDDFPEKFKLNDQGNIISKMYNFSKYYSKIFNRRIKIKQKLLVLCLFYLFKWP